jgi:hypothetical protein
MKHQLITTRPNENRKQAAYAAVLAVLDGELRRPTYAALPRQLAAVVDPARSSVFDEIMF